MQFIVSPDGLEQDDNSELHPWSLTKGLAEVGPGDVLLLRGGTYRGNWTISGLQATPENPIVIRSFEGEQASLEARLADFAVAPNNCWDRVGDSDEYVSKRRYPFDGGNEARGSFIGADGYVRLITHSTLEDLRAHNQLFGPGPDDSTFPCGPIALDATPEHEPLCPPRRPWVYMGPGLCQDDDGFIHVRLSATTNGQPGFPAYAGESDPNQVPLAIWTLLVAALKIEDCSSLHISDITVRYGHATVKLEECTDVRLDHVTVESGSYGIEVGAACHCTVISHCSIDGGMPPWYFRSDRKEEYLYRAVKDDGTTELRTNFLGASTVRASLFGRPDCTDTTITHCEFVNGHDLALFGSDLEFSRNWVFNLNDDALFAEPEGARNLRIFENVFQQCLIVVSMAREVAGNGIFVYRNLIDLRSPTAKNRPRPVGETTPLHHGQLFKGNRPDGPLDLFQNTVIVKDQIVGSSFAHFRSYNDDSQRRAFNNMFVAVDSAPGSDKPITFLPPPASAAVTDGNCYFRLGPFAGGPLLRYFAYDFAGTHVRGGDFDSLDDLRGAPGVEPSEFFVHSTDSYPPGFEGSSIDVDPQFASFDTTDATISPADDFRLGPDSQAAQAGIVLPPHLRLLDGAAAEAKPAIGCFRVGAPPLAVGVDGRRHFP